MFKKSAELKVFDERAHLFCLLNFSLASSLRLSELLGLIILGSGLGWWLGNSFMEALGYAAGSALALLLMLLFLGLLRLPTQIMRASLFKSFQLDSRPWTARFRSQIVSGLCQAPALWLISTLLFWALSYLSMLAWSLLALGFGALITLLWTLFPVLSRPGNLRPLEPGDLSEECLKWVALWQPKTGLGLDRIQVSTTFDPVLRAPYLEGLGPTLRLIIPERALSAFTPGELTALLCSALVAAVGRFPIKFMILRFFSVAVGVPLASILMNSVGVFIWGYPLLQNPVLMTLVWGGAWGGFFLSELALRMVGRPLAAQTDAVTAEVLSAEAFLKKAWFTLARRNLDETEASAWRSFFRRRYNPKRHLEMVDTFRAQAQAAAKK